jgi:hypothetical protein
VDPRSGSRKHYNRHEYGIIDRTVSAVEWLELLTADMSWMTLRNETEKGRRWRYCGGAMLDFLPDLATSF